MMMSEAAGKAGASCDTGDVEGVLVAGLDKSVTLAAALLPLLLLLSSPVGEAESSTGLNVMRPNKRDQIDLCRSAPTVEVEVEVEVSA
jgi:hypothetical protein